MLTPYMSTVTYIHDRGAPTMVLNQTTLFGAQDIPLIPQNGVFSFPKRNKHLMFRGDFNHGVPASLTPQNSKLESEKEGFRTTFLVNWWPKKPMAPNCVKFSDQEFAKLQSNLFTGTRLEELLTRLSWDMENNQAVAGNHAATRVPPVVVDMQDAELKSKAERRVVTVGLDAEMAFDWPNYLPDQADNRGIEIQWGDDQVYGGVGVLNVYTKGV
eukprot:TRINITY_DN33005_c0_g1_i1.p1 TRINITY_DN33005_c0_g1~~TRINITY_DN33005_c0_g1_i1.p1  ORF type:complete len:214 (-),score=55.78 TRINITY_DN33005_c0_g1_i1:224-865(-)